jgi:hypothetical protein
VRSVCKDVYEKFKPQLVSKMGLKDADCEDYNNTEPENGYAELGVKQTTKGHREWFYVYLMWDGTKGGAPEISACVSLDFSKNGDRDDFAKLLRKIPSLQPGDDGPYLWTRKNLSDLSSCPETFYKLLDEWLKGWPDGRKLK